MKKYFLVGLLTFFSIFPSVTMIELENYHKHAIQTLPHHNGYLHHGIYQSPFTVKSYPLTSFNTPSCGIYYIVRSNEGEIRIIEKNFTHKPKETFKAVSESNIPSSWWKNPKGWRKPDRIVTTRGYVEGEVKTLQTLVHGKIKPSVLTAAVILAACAIYGVVNFQRNSLKTENSK